MTSIRLDSETKMMYHKRLQREKRETKEKIAGKLIHVSAELVNLGTEASPYWLKREVDGTRTTGKAKMSKKARKRLRAA